MYVHDVWVNWFYGSFKSFEIPEFHEWWSSDDVEIIDTMPVVYTTKDTFDFVQDGMSELPIEVLDLVRKRAIKRGEGGAKEGIEYAMIITDGTRSLAIDTEGTAVPQRKSKLIPRQDKLLTKLIEDKHVDLEPFSWDYSTKRVEPDYVLSISDRIIDVRQESMAGLTRREKELKRNLFEYLFELSVSDSDIEVFYWYTELFPDRKDVSKSRADMVTEMFEELEIGWNDKHEKFGESFSRSSSYYYDSWRELSKVDKDLVISLEEE
ncbi:hypothetical protein 015DV002_210 [Bacillus phage 015DV002]|nr:hypothetical protein 015DV002_210 [Bacillus phage 015DV002]